MTVNHDVAGSSPAWGATLKIRTLKRVRIFVLLGNAMLGGNIDKCQIKIKRKNNFGGSNGNYRSRKTNRKIT